MDWQTTDEFIWATEVSSQETLPNGAQRPLYRLYIKGPAGNLYCNDIVRVRPGLIDFFYWTMVAVRDGHYHCCLSGNTFIF